MSSLSLCETETYYVKSDVDQRQILIKSGNQFITQLLAYVADLRGTGKLSAEKADGYLKEILHSIFFIGYINKPLSIEPQDLLSDVFSMKESYPDVFEKYKSHLPLRTPYSILLDMVVKTAEEQAKNPLYELSVLNKRMHVPQEGGRSCGNDFCLTSTTVSYCYFEKGNKKSKKYFGASVACTGKAKRDFFINLSCVKTWNRKLALGVCLTDIGKQSIMLPKTVYSAAFTIDRESGKGYVRRRACEKCWEIFPEVVFLPPERDENRANWKHGNCAECEAMSNLLNGEVTVDEGVNWKENLLSTATANERLEPLLKPKIDNLKTTLKNRIEEVEFQFFSP